MNWSESKNIKPSNVLDQLTILRLRNLGRSVIPRELIDFTNPEWDVDTDCYQVSKLRTLGQSTSNSVRAAKDKAQRRCLFDNFF